jgi:hypothetical protein
MTAQTVRLTSVFRSLALPAKRVLFVCYRFKVLVVYTGSVTAPVIELHAGCNWANEVFIRHAVCVVVSTK